MTSIVILALKMTVMTGSIDHFNEVQNENNIQNTTELMVQPIIFEHEAVFADRLGTRMHHFKGLAWCKNRNNNERI
jgi:hypothetical protein